MLCEAYDVALLDLDGVVYVGPDAVPSAPAALEQAAARGMSLAFVTNNAARTPDTVAAHLSELGVPARPDQVVTSAQAAATLVSGMVAPGARVLVVGGEGLEVALRERGLVPVRSADDEPAAVVQGFSPDVGWRDLAEGALALAAGVPWIASNTDLTIPTPRGRAPGNGALVGVLRAATGREPVVAGKPELPLHAEALRRSGARLPLVVGDRLDTDIEGAVRASTPSLLVLTGVTTPRDLVAAPPGLRPSFVSADLTGLLQAHSAPERVGGSWRLGGWKATVDRDVLLVEGSGDPVDALRAACAAAWAEEAFTALRVEAPAGAGF
ncbi:HAD superfamily hydrolase (TIGR01450 family) [Motilibacter peucedani]|uniref:HAD superfamily hydrolase (TIGR01450 family) n=1 Tax=Motilibacter peucedani TaxID=598650 RepID=A0A420XSG6_9ACTN|nr:HAD superfamily hydrolase (TIGR01450 family) [Motilibacter peucedani]